MKDLWVIQRLDTKEFYCGKPSYFSLKFKSNWSKNSIRPHIFSTNPYKYIPTELEDKILVRKLILEELYV